MSESYTRAGDCPGKAQEQQIISDGEAMACERRILSPLAFIFNFDIIAVSCDLFLKEEKSMTKEKMEPYSCAEALVKALPKGILLTTKKGEKVNSMVIGWGAIGVDWGKPVFTAYIRESRFTKELLDATGEFTVNIPVSAVDPQIIKVCGSQSGRDIDKIEALHLTTVPGEKVNAPAIKELPLTLECKVLFRQLQDLKNLDAADQKWYPPFKEGKPDRHIMYEAEIVASYLVR
jgi:flavin reductase (DIM6/NTAB) family NADH-FMN oxidoreductase RutF